MNIVIPEPDEMEQEYTYVFPYSETHKEIIDQFKIYIVENEKWVKKGNHQASVRARNALFDMFKATKKRRYEILAEREETK